MAYPYELTDLARADIDDRAVGLAAASGSIDLGLRFYDAVERTIGEVATAPLRRPLSYHRPPGNRSLRHRLIDGFGNHVLFYDFDGSTVVILRVLHAAMDLPPLLAD